MTPPIRVTSESPQGVGYDLTPLIEDLSWSSVNPGGDERASFTVPGSWRTDRPETATGNVLRVSAGLDVLGQFLIAEHDRSASESERTAITAYGIGQLLKDGTMREVYVDRSASGWTAPTLNQRLQVLSGSAPLDAHYQASADQQSLRFDGTTGADNTIENGSRAVLMYEMPTGLSAGAFEFSGSSAHAANVDSPTLYAADDDSLAFGSWDAYVLTLDDTLRSRDLDTARTFLMLQMRSSSGHTQAAGNPETFTYKFFAVYGDHGLARQDNDTEPRGFTVAQIVADAIGRVSGITPRFVSAGETLIDHLVFAEPTAHEDVVAAADAYELADWGTWGPDSALDRSATGYFDYKARDRATAHWFCSRADCAEVELHDEEATLYDTVEVSYTDEGGTARIATVTAAVSTLPRPRTLAIDGGQLTSTLAERIGQTILDAQGDHAPARGSVTLAAPITHYQRGPLPAHYLRADGSNIRVSDVLPVTELVGLALDADRRSTFPIKRVEVNASGDFPVTAVELDQTFDALSLLQARLGLARDFGPGAGGDRRRGRRGGGRPGRYGP